MKIAVVAALMGIACGMTGCQLPLARTSLSPRAAAEEWHHLHFNTLALRTEYLGYAEEMHHFRVVYRRPVSSRYFAIARSAIRVPLERPVDGRVTPCDRWLEEALAEAIRASGKNSP